jgi:hypothetical protein
MLGNIRLFPTTLNINGIINENLIYGLAVMMTNFGWKRLNQVCGLIGDYRFLQNYCVDTFIPTMQTIAPSLANFHFHRYDLNMKTIDQIQIDNILTNISDTRGK